MALRFVFGEPSSRLIGMRFLFPAVFLLLLACSEQKVGYDRQLESELKRASHYLPPDSQLRRLKARDSAAKAPPKYSVMRSWKPNGDPRGLGLEIVVDGSPTEAQLVSLVKVLSGASDPVFIGAYTSRAAYERSRGSGPAASDAIASGLIFTFVKNTTGAGAYAGFNEIRWMQERGRYASRFGTRTRF